ncbi:MAG: type II and III secretion system protein [Deltaproteobacteria bacterium]|nr:type II and III secretion system protein [Deltaproteobacteria bacterium]
MNSGGAFGTPVDPTIGFSGNGRNTGGSFSTTSPWTTTAGNIGLNFGRLTSSGLGYIALDAALALAETEGKAKIMSAPKVIAREGTAATISSGESIVIGATENVAATTIDATLSLTVTPTAVSYNNFITLDVQVTDDNALASGNIAKKSITTTLMVKNGDTVVIGGVIKETETEDEAGVPGLRKIPFLGWLFKAQNKVHTKSELLIFLTPTVLPSPVKNF